MASFEPTPALDRFAKIQDEVNGGPDPSVGKLADTLYRETIEPDEQPDDKKSAEDKKNAELLAVLEEIFETELELRALQADLGKSAAEGVMARKRMRVDRDDDDDEEEEEERDFQFVPKRSKRGGARSPTFSSSLLRRGTKETDVFRVLMELLFSSLKLKPVHKSEAYKLVTRGLGQVDIPDITLVEFKTLLAGDICMQMFMSLLIAIPIKKKKDRRATAWYLQFFGDPHRKGGNTVHKNIWMGLCKRDVRIFEDVLQGEEMTNDPVLKAWFEKLVTVVKYCFEADLNSSRRRDDAPQTSVAGEC
jgi:hypothetical protein